MLEFDKIIQLVGEYVREHESLMLPKMKEGLAYYRTENPDIMKRKRQYFSSNRMMPVEDPYKANNKLASAFVKLLVNQKINYSVNDRLSVSVKQSTQEDIVKDELRFKSFKKTLKKVCKDASNKSYGVMQLFVNAEQQFDYKHIPAEQVIRIPNMDDEEITDAVIRYYTMDVVNSANKVVQMVIAEYYDDEYVYYLSKLPDDEKFKVAPQSLYENNPVRHLSLVTVATGREVEREGKSWSVPPFAFLYNNDEKQRDLDPILPMLKAWDFVMSDFANNLEDFQDIYWILKGYGGQDIDEFLQEVKKHKVLKTDEDGDARAETIEIPAEARTLMLDRLEKAIYKFGQGVNADDIQGDITNVRIYSLFYGLDQKANDFEMEINSFFDQVLILMNDYLKISNKQLINAEDIDLSFKRSMILNKSEVIDDLLKQRGFLSDKTLLEMHPDVDDVDEELERMKEDAQEQAKLLGGGLGFKEPAGNNESEEQIGGE